MSRKKKLLLNTGTSILHQLITLICGFILPRMYLVCYGSDVNGLVSSISQFLGFISFADLGVGAVVQASLYKPLAEKDNDQLSRVIKSSSSFYQKIALLLIVYTFALGIVYPSIASVSFDWLFTASLIVIISISMFAQYFFGITYSILLNADQKGYIQLIVHSASLIFNTLISVFLMNAGFSIHLVKLISAMIFVIQPLILATYANKHYKINKKIELNGEPIKQKWNGLAQHWATVVLNNTDSVVLTFFSSLKNVSIYGVYYIVVNGVKQIVLALTNGVDSLLGNMLAKREDELINQVFSAYEWLIHTLVSLLFGITAIVILPFISVYTKGVTDANYIVPLFAWILTSAQGAYCLRLPYNSLVLAAGHFKETQWSAIIEALLNITISILFVFKFGLVGVAVGTLSAMIFRTIYLVHYLSKNIIFRKVASFYKHVFVDAVQIFVMIFCSSWIELGEPTYISWFVMASEVGAISLIVVLGTNIVFYSQTMKDTIKIILKRNSMR